MRQPLVIRRADRAMMLSWTKISDVTCCAGQKMKFAASAGNTDGTHPEARAERQRQLGLERSAAAELGQPYARHVDLVVRWVPGTPCRCCYPPEDLCSLYLSVPDPIADETFHSVRDPQADGDHGSWSSDGWRQVEVGSPDDRYSTGRAGAEGWHPTAHMRLRIHPGCTELMVVDRAHEHVGESQWAGDAISCLPSVAKRWNHRPVDDHTVRGTARVEVLARLGGEAL